MGSFLNVCIYRLPKNISIIKPPSFCPHCRTHIRWFRNIPIFSFILLRGRCSGCGKKISWRYIVVESITGFIFLILFSHFGFSLLFLIYCVFSSFLIVASFIDLEYRIIPDCISLGLLPIGIIISVVFPALHYTQNYKLALINSLLGILAGGGSIYILGVLGKVLFKKESMGFGDVKLMAMIGAFLGWRLTILTFFIAPFFGSVVGIVLKIKYKEQYIPYGPFLSLASFVSVLWGYRILNLILFRSYY